MKAFSRLMWWIPKGSLAGLIGTAVLWASPGTAQEEEVLAAGKREFRHHCAVCHGLGGKGESVMTTFNLLTVTPTDLTQLSRQNKGQFPFWRVYRIIDGREEVKAHGSRDMPIWGDAFLQEEEGTSAAARARTLGRILLLVHYLESIQE